MNSAEFLGEDSPLRAILPRFSPRKVQQEMAGAVENAIRQRSTIIIEAPTGIGKTLAYLVPALMAGKKTIVSTGTKNLQDQLFFKDLPLLRKVLPKGVTIALLKGRANYLCLHRLETNSEEGLFMTKQAVHDLQSVKKWAKKTGAGDISELHTVPEESAVWPAVTSTADNCLGAECEKFNDCYLVKARRKAMSADIVVINHHLFFADMAIKEEGFGELLPGVDVVILDEAHQLPEAALYFFGQRFSSRQLLRLFTDIEAECINAAVDLKSIEGFIERIKYHLEAFRESLGDSGARAPWSKLSNNDKVLEKGKELLEDLSGLMELIKPLKAQGSGFANCITRLEEHSKVAKSFFSNQKNVKEEVQWYETYFKSFTLQITPLRPAQSLQDFLASPQNAWVFTSATLTVNHDFAHFCQELGIEGAETLALESPFDYKQQALMYVPKKMPPSQSPVFIKTMVEKAIPLIEAYEGKTFLLFTSHRALRIAADILSDRCDYPLFIQGDSTKRQLLERFVQSGNGVLLGTSSFWEGVDVQGDALSCVVIDKLPFASPGDPIVQARADLLKQQGKDAFRTYQLPSAVIALKQGVGRLIRDVKDTGVLMICDRRLLEKPYGKIFLDSLPRMLRTQDQEKVLKFITHTKQLRI